MKHSFEAPLKDNQSVTYLLYWVTLSHKTSPKKYREYLRLLTPVDYREVFTSHAVRQLVFKEAYYSML